MPYKIQDENITQPNTRVARTYRQTDPVRQWLVNQEFDVNRAWQQQGNYRRGTLTGGPSYERFLDFGNEKQWAIYRPQPILTTPILQDEQQFYRRQLGAIEWDSINPFNTVDQVADQVSQATGSDPLGFLRGAGDFLASKDVDPFGMGSTGAPARAADYALAFPIAIWQKLTGQQSDPSHPLPQDDIYRGFHADPRYWNTIQTASPDQMKALALQVAGQFFDPASNTYMVEQLLHQFQVDKDKAAALTSGNEAVDYQAIKAATQFQAATNVGGSSLFLGSGSGFTKIPVVGTQVANFIDPITPAERDLWNQMTPQDRQKYLARYGFVQMGTDFISSLPALSGFSTVLMLAKGGGVVTRTIAEGYDWLLRGAGWVATAGLTAATVNWAAEASIPGYSDFLGNAVDRARPISGSELAGAVNAVGYWATGTYGASNLIRAGARGVRYAQDANLAVRTAAARDRGIFQPSIGGPELEVYNVGHGGARTMNWMVENAGLDARAIELSQKRIVMSYLVHLAQQPAINTWKAIISGAKSGRKEIDELDLPERVAAASAELDAAQGESHHVAQIYAQVMVAARQPARLFRSDAALQVYRNIKDWSRSIDQAIAERYMHDYGPGWVNRMAGAYTPAAMEQWVTSALERLGADTSHLGSIKGTDQWAKVMRLVHQYEFDWNNGELQAALDYKVGGEVAHEAGKLSMVSQHHLFNDQVDAVLAVLRGEDKEAAQAEVKRLVDDTIEIERWYSNDFRPQGEKSVESVNPETLANYIEDVQPGLLIRRGHPKAGSDTALLPLNAFHTKLVEDGVWELAFKPVDEAGNAVSYIHTRNGYAFQTPWLDYPVSNLDNIALGNRGMVMAKYDAALRGFRTWRIAEFQRASMYRSLTSRFEFTSTQIDQFHQGVLEIAHRFSVQPQTLGTVTEGIAGTGTVFRDELDALANRVFGPGPYRNRFTGKVEPIDWRKEVARDYRQSLKLNFTAGLTSHMKSRFGPLGASIAWMSDIGYVNLRFNFSPLFKGGEVVESRMFKAMTSARSADPWTEALFYRVAGVGDDYGVVASEMTYDQTLQGLTPLAGKRARTKEERQATSYVMTARSAPETMDQKIRAAEIQQRVEAHQAYVQGGGSVYASGRHALEVEVARYVDGNGNIIPGHEDRVAELLKILDSSMTEDEIRAANHVGPELPNNQWSTDPADLGPGYDINKNGPSWLDETQLPEDRGLWHATTEVDSVHNTGLKSAIEVRQMPGKENKASLGGISAAVSLTTEYMHAEAIAERLRLATLAAQDKLSFRQVAEEGLQLLDEAAGGDEYGALAHVSMIAGIFERALKNNGIVPGSGVVNALRHVQNEDQLFKVLDDIEADAVKHAGPLDPNLPNGTMRMEATPQNMGDAKYQAVQAIDYTLPHQADEINNRAMAVGLVGDADQARANDASQIGIVQVGIRKGAKFTEGPDTWEIKVNSGDIWTLDRRILDHPLADNTDDLLAQLNSTVRQDGTVMPGFQAYHDAIVERLNELNPPVPTADKIEDVFGTPEHLIQLLEETDAAGLHSTAFDKPGAARRAWEELKNPIPGKQHQATLSRIEKLQRDFPSLLEVAGLDGATQVFKSLGLAPDEWLPFLLRDRELATQFHNTGSVEDFDALIQFAGGEPTQTAFDELYRSEEWQALVGLFAIADRTAADEAFRVHFFNPYRSAVERSLNHPLMGIYPLSWAYKAARQWMAFLYENRTFPELRLGMSPAVALNAIVRAQNIAVAQTSETDLESFMDTSGPYGATFMIFNLLLPGDWSTIPFPASRTIRDIVRGNITSPDAILNNVTSLGAARDLRLGLEMTGELQDAITHGMVDTDPATGLPVPWKPPKAPAPWKKPKAKPSVLYPLPDTSR